MNKGSGTIEVSIPSSSVILRHVGISCEFIQPYSIKGPVFSLTSSSSYYPYRSMSYVNGISNQQNTKSLKYDFDKNELYQDTPTSVSQDIDTEVNAIHYSRTNLKEGEMNVDKMLEICQYFLGKNVYSSDSSTPDGLIFKVPSVASHNMCP